MVIAKDTAAMTAAGRRIRFPMIPSPRPTASESMLVATDKTSSLASLVWSGFASAPTSKDSQIIFPPMKARSPKATQ